MKETITIGNAGGYWGDDPQALKRQVTGGKLDYITIDFLAEVTMSILRKQQLRDPETGYARDFLTMLEPVLSQMLQQGTRIITNAGGINPRQLALECARLAQKQNLSPKIALVFGDDILDRIDELQAAGVSFENMETAQNFSSVKDQIEAANVYFGATAVVKALDLWQPDIIVTGRVTDTGITVGAMMHELGWAADDWDKLAAGTVAGHMIECGSQVSGGNFTDWRQIKSFDGIGYPIIEMSQDGSFIITKHPNSGGLVSTDTVREQVFYEMGNPTCYITPDVIADFTTIRLEDAGENRVKVSGIKGREPTPSYKISMAHKAGFRVSGNILVSGPDARAKSEKFAEIFWKRVGQVSEQSTEYLGWNACHRSLGFAEDGQEIVLQLSARSDDDQQLRALGRSIPSLILSGPPGVAVLGGVSRPTEVISFWPTLIDKDLVLPQIGLVVGNDVTVEPVGEIPKGSSELSEPSTMQVADQTSSDIQAAMANYLAPTGSPLSAIAIGRSGDKGDTVNIGLCARSPAAYLYIKNIVTAQLVRDLFQELCFGKVVRYELDGLNGLNFLLHESLGGGGSCTLRADAQGKTFAQALLRQKFDIPNDVLSTVST